MKISCSWKVILFPAIIGMICFANGMWIHGKALLAQTLLQRAWAQTQVRGESVKPWPWADTWPVARLQAAGPDTAVLLPEDGDEAAFWKAAAAGALESALEIKPDHVKSLINYGRILLAQERTDEAKVQIEKALATAPGNTAATRVLGRIQHAAMPARGKTGIGRCDQIARRIGQRAIQIKHHRAHFAPNLRNTAKGSVKTRPLRQG